MTVVIGQHRPEQFDEWLDRGSGLTLMASAALWLLGDWLLEGIDRYGNRHTAARTVTGLDVKTLEDLAHVALTYEPARRRTDDLSWHHHAAIVDLPPDQQDLLLAQAARDRCTVARLRALAKDHA